MSILGSSWKEDSDDDIGPFSHWKDGEDSSKVEYITLDSKEDIIKAYRKLSFKDKRYVEIIIFKEKMKRVNLNKKKL